MFLTGHKGSPFNYNLIYVNLNKYFFLYQNVLTVQAIKQANIFLTLFIEWCGSGLNNNYKVTTCIRKVNSVNKFVFENFKGLIK